MFFGRIMKEHSFFLKAGFTPANKDFSEKAEYFKNAFDKLLCEAVMLGNGFVNQQILCSQELVMQFTSLAEKQTECLTGISINKGITDRELQLKSGCGKCGSDPERRRKVYQLNQTSLKLLDGLI